MMNKVYKIIAYIAISFGVSYLISIGDSSFFGGFRNNVIALLATLLAINITASALISGELNKLKQKFPNSNIQESNVSLKKTFVSQIAFLLGLFLVLVLRDFFFTKDILDRKWVTLISDTAIIGVFLYYIETIYDLGCALYSILQFNSKNNN